MPDKRRNVLRIDFDLVINFLKGNCLNCLECSSPLTSEKGPDISLTKR